MADRASPHIKFSVDQIPRVPGPMPLLKLEDPVIVSEDRLEELTQAIAPNGSFRELKQGAGRAAYDGERLVAAVNAKAGESRLFPALESLRPAQRLAERAKGAGEGFAGDRELFPEDGTTVVARAPATLVGSRHRRDMRSEPFEYLGYVRLQRQVQGAPVFGPGTRAMLAVDGNETIQSFSHRYRTSMPTGDEVESRPRDEIAKGIIAQLWNGEKSAEVTVDKVAVGYYDSGRDFCSRCIDFMQRSGPRRPRSTS